MKYVLVSKNILLDGLNPFHGINLTLSSDVGHCHQLRLLVVDTLKQVSQDNVKPLHSQF